MRGEQPTYPGAIISAIAPADGAGARLEARYGVHFGSAPAVIGIPYRPDKPAAYGGTRAGMHLLSQIDALWSGVPFNWRKWTVALVNAAERGGGAKHEFANGADF